jgi:hypothetical protein
MHDTNLFKRALAPSFVVLIALACGSCSSDTRPVLAPSDAQISLAASGPLIANQAVEITVAALKSDGSPVKDGTEIQLTASAGEFESTKVRTHGGQALAIYHPSGSGTVELGAASDEAQGRVVLMALSALPTRVSVSASAESVPDGGGELDVTATVFGPSGEPVAGAAVEFFATNGSFAPVGPFLTNAEGTATVRLTTPSATGVRARVLAIESSLLEIAVLPPLRKGDANLPFRMSEVVYLNANVSEWDVTSEVTDVIIDHNTICIEHTMSGRWPRFRGGGNVIGEGNPWVFANIGGTWYAATYEFLRSGQTCKHIERRGEWGIGPHTKRQPLESWAPRKGELVGFMVSTPARDSTRTSNERSNVWMMEWPY